MLERDSYHSFSANVYASALEMANPQQKAHLQAEVRGAINRGRALAPRTTN